MSNQAISTGTASATFSPALAAGRWRFRWLAGQPISQCGLDRALASLSARQAKARGLLTSGTCGQSSTGLSRNAALNESLGSRLQASLAWLGSTLYRLTWRQKATPQGQRYWQHVASVPRTCANASTGVQKNWPTPTAMDTIERQGMRPSRAATGRTTGYLSEIVPLVAWPTPQTSDGSGGGQAKRATNPERSNDLNDFAMLGGRPTCAARDWKGRPGMATTANADVEIYNKTLKSTAWVLAKTGGETSSGTGVLVDAEKKIKSRQAPAQS